jgi:hypothetical protein
MSVIRVNRESLRHYASSATDRFGHSRTELEALIREAVEVRYFGPNAVEFKTRCGQMAAEYSTKLLQDFTSIAEAVRASTTAIASSLGDVPIVLSVDGSPVAAPPVPPADGGVVDIDVSALEALKPVVSRRIAAVRDALTQHLSSLQGTDWEGEAKNSAVDAVSRFTSAAQQKATDAETSINAYIDSQISSVLAADH